MSPYTTGSGYLNFEPAEGRSIRHAYADNYQRLQRLKAAWDPDNLSRFNHDIAPAGQ